MRSYLTQIILSGLLTITLLFPILKPGVWYPMHDSTHLERVILMRETIALGQFPPIWAYGINSGYGYPLFHFYAPLFHYLAVFFSYFVTTAAALKLTLGLTIFTGILGIMQFAKKWGRGASLLAAFAFAFAPYLAINLYVRGAYSELLAICLLPWIFLATTKLDSPRRYILGAVSLSLFVLAHNLVPLFVLPLVFAWMLLNNRPKSIFLTITLAFLLSSWFVLPLLFERSFTQVDSIAQTTDYSRHFLEPWQLWDSTWGYGGSALGVEDGMSFKLGKLQLLLAGLGIVAAIIRRRGLMLTFALMLSLMLFLSLPWSKLLWDHLPLLSLVQFPWRTLGPATFFLVILGTFGYSQLKFKPLRYFLLIIFIPAFYYYGYQYFRPQTLSSDSEYQGIDIARVVPEYLPVSMPDFPAVPAAPGELAYYPTWKATYQGSKIAVYPDDLGILRFDSRYDPAEVQLRQSHTLLQQFSYLITALTFIYTLIAWKKYV